MEAVRTTASTPTLAPASEKASQKKESESSLNNLFIQPKLTIGSADDPLEKEADDMADKVMRMEMPPSINFSSSKNSVNRKCEHCEEEEKQLQRKESGGDSVSVAPPIVHDVINSSGGKSLDTATRSFMEPRFNYDFSSVKVHDGDVAAKSASSINALAYTSGNNVVFNSGQYNTTSASGKKLLAHELTHVVQQGTNVAKKVQRLGDLTKVPPMVCDVANTSPGGTTAFTALFSTSKTDLTAAQKSDIAIFVASWQASGGTDFLRVDGYASTPGGDEMNWRLSCDRAFAVANELVLNGVPNSMVEFFAQGETSQFGGQLQNQRAEITIIPATPAKKKVTINYTLLEGGTASIDTAISYANNNVYNQANVELEKGTESKLDLTQTQAILGNDLIVDEYANPATPTTEEQNLLKENQSAGAITVYFVKGFSAGSLGEAFWPSSGSGLVGFIVGNTRPDNTFSHELGHVLLDAGDHVVPDATYLMHTTAPDPRKLTPGQITKILASPYVK